MTGQKGIPIVGGPMDGQWWPAGEPAPRCAERAPSTPTIYDAPPSPEATKVKTIAYARRTMRQPLGAVPSKIDIFAPEDWSTEQIVEHLDRHHPNGFA